MILLLKDAEISFEKLKYSYWHNGLISTTGSKAHVMGGAPAAIVCVPSSMHLHAAIPVEVSVDGSLWEIFGHGNFSKEK